MRPLLLTSSPTTQQSSFQRRVTRSLLATLAVGAILSSATAPAFADTDSDSVEANVVVNPSLTLTGLTAAFTLTGDINAAVEGLRAVSFAVSSNNAAGYAVTVQSDSDTLDPTTTANTDTIPIGALGVRESGSSTYTPVSDATAVTVHRQTTPSLAAGDALGNDYRIDIPFVNPDTYTTTLNYVATTL